MQGVGAKLTFSMGENLRLARPMRYFYGVYSGNGLGFPPLKQPLRKENPLVVSTVAWSG